MSGLQFPPLFSGMATAGADPVAAACAEARRGCDAGLVTYDVTAERLRAAIVFAPEVPLSEALIMLPVCGIGFQNALGAIAPPEVSVHLEWSGRIRVNGASAGAISCFASHREPGAEPDWLVIGLDLALADGAEETGMTPDVTTLYAEGCAEVDPGDLLEAWVRHSLVWLNRWTDEGLRPLHREWEGLAHGLKEQATLAGHTGTFIGVDETFGMLLQHDGETRIIPLTDLLQDTP
ncbi:biotin/lipoate--protein ligase family protein [uncultured Roseobacter sp.]|uniref:biotin/lipoate--protein ligase family protein n=1 Tax=uncultured Roseobacter sp. TaxID=114847 RepID=UPI002613E9BD|nr:biotin/lipoate--protein ligase family protein [uncultured Roseobacter sp.]